MKHLIFDVNVIIDYWLHERSAASTLQLLRPDATQSVKTWIVASQLHTLHYTSRSVFKRKGVPPEQVTQVVKSLLETLLQRVEVLSNFGFEQSTVYQQARDFEDAQITAAARSLGGQQVCVVTEENTMTGAQICLQLGQTGGDCRRHHQPPAQRVCYQVSPVFSVR